MNIRKHLRKLLKKFDINQINDTLVELAGPVHRAITKQPKPQTARSPIIVRYLRPECEDTGQHHNLGGVTAAFVIDYQTNTVEAGYAVAADDENFDKEVGRMLAISRLEDRGAFYLRFPRTDEPLMVQLIEHAHKKPAKHRRLVEVTEMVDSGYEF